MVIDAFGKQCPAPLVMAKKEIDTGNHDVQIQVDNETSVKNLTRLANKKGLAIDVEKIDGGYLVSFSDPEEGYQPPEPTEVAQAAGIDASAATGSGYAVFVSKDHLGEGDPTLGRNLIKMALYTLSESDDAPVSLLFMNSGVKLVADPEQTDIVESVRKLADQGTEVLVCGTCLNFYDLTDQLQVGEVSNMYEILERMREASNVITL
jgi:selenium metabolism protein YedF